MNDVEAKLMEAQEGALAALVDVQSEPGLEEWKQANLGKTSLVMRRFGSLGQVPKEDRPAVGRAVNALKVALETAFTEKQQVVKQNQLSQAIASEKLDITLPGRALRRGRLHPLNMTLREIYRVFGDMGFQIYRSPEVELDDFNFTFLNIPPYHPARDMWDTFYTETEGVLLRTHTSPGQIRVMRERAPEDIRVILPGVCMRYEQLTARSEIEFIQIEVLVVGKGISFADMKGTLKDFVARTFGPEARTRLRPSYFPFTEPSAEMDVECFICGGEGCGVCKGSGWLEILGCGMVHPTVLQYGGYDPSVYSGFAAGMGIDRSTLMRYRIDDIRHFRNNDIRFLEQY